MLGSPDSSAYSGATDTAKVLNWGFTLQQARGSRGLILAGWCCWGGDVVSGRRCCWGRLGSGFRGAVWETAFRVRDSGDAALAEEAAVLGLVALS